MTDQEQRIKIAEICGWTNIKPQLMYANQLYGNSPDIDSDWTCIPDYTKDLNAIHEAIKLQPPDIQWMIFALLVEEVNANYPAFLGTAKQYCVAFLKALGQYKIV